MSNTHPSHEHSYPIHIDPMFDEILGKHKKASSRRRLRRMRHKSSQRRKSKQRRLTHQFSRDIY